MEEQTSFVPFTLAKMAYHACSIEDRAKYDEAETPEIEIASCCCALLDHRSPSPDLSVCQVAAENMHFDCLSVGRAAGHPWDEEVSNHAIYTGNLELVKFLHRGGCPWDSNAIMAATVNSMEMLTYVMSNGGQLSASACFSAIVGDMPDRLQYLLANGCPLVDICVNRAGRDGRLECLRVIKAFRRDLLVGQVVRQAIFGGHLNCVQYLVEEVGVRVNNGLLDLAVFQEREDIADCLRRNF